MAASDTSAQHTPEPKAGVALALHIGQHVRHRDYKGERVIGTIRALAVEDQALMATITLDQPIIIPAEHGHRQIDIYTQHVPAHELAPFDDRDDLITEMLAALHEALEFVEDQVDVVDGPDGEQVPNNAMLLAQTLRDALARATGASNA